MKKLLGAMCLMAVLAGWSHAVVMDTWVSSETAVAESTQPLCGQYLVGTSTVVTHGVLHGVCVNTAAAGNVQVFTSSWTASSGTITGLYSTATQVPCNYYDVASPNGLAYNKNGTADVTILYSCY